MALFQRKKPAFTDISQIEMPKHVGIIMDGNGRWAKKRGLPRSAGHTAGAQVFRKIARYCNNIGIKYLTVYAFSTENWRRPEKEINALMKLFKEYLEEALRDFRDDCIVMRFIGDRSAFSPALLELMEENEEIAKDRDGMVLNIAMNYGGRAELVTAIQNIAGDVKDGRLGADQIDDQLISDYLYTKGQPDPDLIIRPSGEHRTSNFLLWQSAYSEYVIMDVLWPDFTEEHLNQALIEYANRSRRFGGV